MNLTDAKILTNQLIAKNIFSMTLHAPDIAETARAGQFVMVYLNRGEMLLPRPISICDAGLNPGEIHLVYAVAGAGTEVLSAMKSGENIRLLGALGNGFLTDDNDKTKRTRVAIVGGGIGSPPLYFLAKELKNHGVCTDVFLGFRAEPILTEMFKNVADRLFITTEDGSFGHRGLITEVLSAQKIEYDRIYSCGPLPLLRAVAELAHEKNIPCKISVEERMACGIGACVGCVVKAGETYVKVCAEGPVFDSREITRRIF
jgi:dihydroorotate dehydrogenase electron transfer subunit